MKAGRKAVDSDPMPSDLLLSGPLVWPKLTCEDIVDVVICRRPELIYLRVARIIASANLPRDVKVYLRQLRRYAGENAWTRTTIKTSFRHSIPEDGPNEDDVREYLVKLRFHMKRIMPDEPDLTRGISIEIKRTSGSSATLAKISEKWL